MASSIIPLRLSSEVEWEARLKAAYDALPKTRRMEYLRGLLQRGLLAVEAEQAGDAGMTSVPLPPAAAMRPVAATPKTVVPPPKVAAPVPEPAATASPALAPAAVVPAPVAPAPPGATKSALAILGGSNFLGAARSSSQTQTPSSQA